MGWASGSRIAEEIWVKLRPFISPCNYMEVSKAIVIQFCENDADDWEVYPSMNCLYYVYLKYNKPEELKEYELEERE